MIRAKVRARLGTCFVLGSGEHVRLPPGATDYPLIDDDVSVVGDVIVTVHHTRIKFGYDNREEFAR